MNAIVLNTLNAAVTEYDWTFQSITPTHAGDATGLFQMGGTDDDGNAIAAAFDTGVTLCGSSLKKRVPTVFLSMTGTGRGTFRVHGKSQTWSFPVQVQAEGGSRAKPGMGIHQHYLGFGYSNAAGAAFTLDRIEIPLAQDKSRRTS